MSNYEHYKGRGVLSVEERDRQKAETREWIREREAARVADLERSRLSAIEYDRRWEQKAANSGLDDIIEIPGKQGDKDIVFRMRLLAGGRLEEVDLIIKDQ